MKEQHRMELEAAAKWPERAIWFLVLGCVVWSLLGCGGQGGEEDEPSHSDRLPITCPGEACK